MFGTGSLEAYFTHPHISCLAVFDLTSDTLGLEVSDLDVYVKQLYKCLARCRLRERERLRPRRRLRLRLRLLLRLRLRLRLGERRGAAFTNQLEKRVMP